MTSKKTDTKLQLLRNGLDETMTRSIVDSFSFDMNKGIHAGNGRIFYIYADFGFANIFKKLTETLTAATPRGIFYVDGGEIAPADGEDLIDILFTSNVGNLTKLEITIYSDDSFKIYGFSDNKGWEASFRVYPIIRYSKSEIEGIIDQITEFKFAYFRYSNGRDRSNRDYMESRASDILYLLDMPQKTDEYFSELTPLKMWGVIETALATRANDLLLYQFNDWSSLLESPNA